MEGQTSTGGRVVDTPPDRSGHVPGSSGALVALGEDREWYTHLKEDQPGRSGALTSINPAGEGNHRGEQREEPSPTTTYGYGQGQGVGLSLPDSQETSNAVYYLQAQWVDKEAEAADVHDLSAPASPRESVVTLDVPAERPPVSPSSPGRVIYMGRSGALPSGNGATLSRLTPWSSQSGAVSPRPAQPVYLSPQPPSARPPWSPWVGEASTTRAQHGRRSTDIPRKGRTATGLSTTYGHGQLRAPSRATQLARPGATVMVGSSRPGVTGNAEV